MYVGDDLVDYIDIMGFLGDCVSFMVSYFEGFCDEFGGVVLGGYGCGFKGIKLIVLLFGKVKI